MALAGSRPRATISPTVKDGAGLVVAAGGETTQAGVWLQVWLRSEDAGSRRARAKRAWMSSYRLEFMFKLRMECGAEAPGEGRKEKDTGRLRPGRGRTSRNGLEKLAAWLRLAPFASDADQGVR